MVRKRKEWPPWWEWELDLQEHVLDRMEEGRCTEVELRRMMEHATDYQRDIVEGRWVIKTRHQGRAWEVIVEPNSATELLEVWTAYEVTRRKRKK